MEDAIKGVSLNGHAKEAEHQRTVTGVLTSRPTSRDIKIDAFSMGLNGQELIQDCSIELTIGRRYGLLGSNGSGKTNFLKCLANREVSSWKIKRDVLQRPCRTTRDQNKLGQVYLHLTCEGV